MVDQVDGSQLQEFLANNQPVIMCIKSNDFIAIIANIV